MRSKYTLGWWFFVSDSQKNRLSDTIFYQRFLIVHSPIIFNCMDCPRLVLNQRFLMTYSSLIFIWFLYAQIALVLVLNQRFLIVLASLIFCMRRMSRHLNQRFVAEYSQLVFVWFFSAQNCPKIPHYISLFLSYYLQFLNVFSIFLQFLLREFRVNDLFPWHKQILSFQTTIHTLFERSLTCKSQIVRNQKKWERIKLTEFLC